MKFNLIITDIARLHALEASEYYDLQNEGLSEQFLLDLDAAYDDITKHPEYYSFISVKRGIRDHSLRRFPYVVIYRVIGNNVIVADVFNTHQKPRF